MKQNKALNLRQLEFYQRNEITEYYIYKNLASRVSGVKNRRVMAQIADDELRHYNIWKGYTQKDVKPSRLRIWFYTFVSLMFGFTFGIRLMEKGEQHAHDAYSRLMHASPEIDGILRDEEEHEEALIQLLDEERLQYTGSIVLGLNDALVELMGVLAGLTFALPNTRFVALTASITGFAAALSMAASEYLSTKSESDGRNPFSAAFYTGIAYILTVVLLVLPYFFIGDPLTSLGISFLGAVLIIGFFNYYISIARNESFKGRFFEMVGLSFSVAALSFLAGYLIRVVFGIEI